MGMGGGEGVSLSLCCSSIQHLGGLSHQGSSALKHRQAYSQPLHSRVSSVSTGPIRSALAITAPPYHTVVLLRNACQPACVRVLLCPAVKFLNPFNMRADMHLLDALYGAARYF